MPTQIKYDDLLPAHKELIDLIQSIGIKALMYHPQSNVIDIRYLNSQLASIEVTDIEVPSQD